ncbi:hypothetical protein [Pseudomonas sp. McL0111]|uniref:hypothetical protein n=1 Tax=Pseudomonas sp. McL0111 TaxID=3457357 RepID=UPI00403ECF42
MVFSLATSQVLFTACTLALDARFACRWGAGFDDCRTRTLPMKFEKNTELDQANLRIIIAGIAEPAEKA